jgi:hypothetical protein
MRRIVGIGIAVAVIIGALGVLAALDGYSVSVYEAPPTASPIIAPTASPAAGISAAAALLAQQLAGECTGMTPAQVAAYAEAEARQMGGTTPERILSVAVKTPAMAANVGTCAAAIQSAAIYDSVYGS